MNQDTRLDNRIIDIRVSGGSHCGAWRCECADSGVHGGSGSGALSGMTCTKVLCLANNGPGDYRHASMLCACKLNVIFLAVV